MIYKVNITNLSTITTEHNLNFLKIFNSKYAEKVGNRILSKLNFNPILSRITCYFYTYINTGECIYD